MDLLFASQAAPLFAGRGRLISKLIEGDPVAWSILGGVVAVMIIWAIIKAQLNKGGGEE